MYVALVRRSGLGAFVVRSFVGSFVARVCIQSPP